MSLALLQQALAHTLYTVTVSFIYIKVFLTV